MKSYALFTGCMIYSRVPHIEDVSVRVLLRLGIEARRLDGFTCCPEPTSMKMLSQRAWYALAARNLSVAEEAGLNIITLCSGCNATLFRVAEDLRRDERLRSRVNEDLKVVGRFYKGGVEVRSLLRTLYEEVGVEELRRAAVRPLKRVRAAVHHGCHSYDELSHFDDPLRPKAFKEVLEALGCDVVDYSLEGLCCGYFIRPVDEELSLMMVREKLEDVKRAGANCLAVLCPTCFIQLDASQAMISRKMRAQLNMPVFYLTQLIGLSMGMGMEEIGLKYHSVRTGGAVEELKKA